MLDHAYFEHTPLTHQFKTALFLFERRATSKRKHYMFLLLEPKSNDVSNNLTATHEVLNVFQDQLFVTQSCFKNRAAHSNVLLNHNTTWETRTFEHIKYRTITCLSTLFI